MRSLLLSQVIDKIILLTIVIWIHNILKQISSPSDATINNFAIGFLYFEIIFQLVLAILHLIEYWSN